jgi:hypothetical protein
VQKNYFPEKEMFNKVYLIDTGPGDLRSITVLLFKKEKGL